MSNENKRFDKLETKSIFKVLKKPSYRFQRFDKLEIDGHNIDLGAGYSNKSLDTKKHLDGSVCSQCGRKVSDNQSFCYYCGKRLKPWEKDVFICPKCGRFNSKESLYCIYCKYVFKEVAEENEESKIGLHQMICPQCNRVIARNQESCFFCGYKFILHNTELKDYQVDPLKIGETISVTIDGKKYSTTDNDIPPEIGQLMLKIKKEGFSQEVLKNWYSERMKVLTERKNEIRNRYTSFIRRLVIFVLFIFFIYLYLRTFHFPLLQAAPLITIFYTSFYFLIFALFILTLIRFIFNLFSRRK